MYVYVFVGYKKGSITFDPNNATFTQKIDDCMGRVIDVIRPKKAQNWNVLGRYQNSILFTGD